MSETTPLIKAALNLRVGVGFDVYAHTLKKDSYKPLRSIIALILYITHAELFQYRSILFLFLHHVVYPLSIYVKWL